MGRLSGESSPEVCWCKRSGNYTFVFQGLASLPSAEQPIAGRPWGPSSVQPLTDSRRRPSAGRPTALLAGGPLTWSGYQPPAEVSNGSSESALPGLKVQVRDETTGAIAGYTIDQLDNKILNSLWKLLKTSDGNGFIGAEQIVESLDKDVRIVGLHDPSEALLSFAGVPSAGFWSSIIQEAPIAAIDKPLGSIQRLLELAGIVIGTLSGNPALAYACFKAMLHDEVHRMSVAVIEHLIVGDPSRTPRETPAKPNQSVGAVLETHSLRGGSAVVPITVPEWKRARRKSLPWATS